MKAVRIHHHGGVEELRVDEIPVPSIQPREVLLEVKSTGLNHLDLWVRRGIPGLKLPLPLVLGSDASGVIHKVGSEVKRWNPGDRVMVVPGYGCGQCPECRSGRENYCAKYSIGGEHGNGVQAEFLALDEERLISMPPNISFEDAAAIPLVFQTAWEMLVNKAKIQPGETALIWGASSGVGSAAVQIAAMLGARVITIAGGAEKVEKAKQLAPKLDVIDYQARDVSREIKTLTAGRGVDVVIDHVGEATFEKSLRAMNIGGRLVFCGATTGPAVKFDLRYVFFKQQSILGSTMGNRGDLAKIGSLVGQGKLHAVVDRVFEVEAIRNAHEYLESGRQFGKVVVRFAK
ncbi:MAG: zinc-binding dehydrogenase [Acidobacteriia bacterium]|nr:zinc-binding dehydrogenase [Terriglobia bacterium]